MNWNERCLKQLAKDRVEVEKKYGIRIRKTDIHCSICGRKWDLTGSNGCQGAVAHRSMLLDKSLVLAPVKSSNSTFRTKK